MAFARVVREDFEKFRKFPDAIARVRYPIDIHNPNGQGTEIVEVPEDQWYEIPYGSIVTKDCRKPVDGRASDLGGSRHSQLDARDAAGGEHWAGRPGWRRRWPYAKAKSPHDLDGVEIRRRLRARGANL